MYVCRALSNIHRPQRTACVRRRCKSLLQQHTHAKQITQRYHYCHCSRWCPRSSSILLSLCMFHKSHTSHPTTVHSIYALALARTLRHGQPLSPPLPRRVWYIVSVVIHTHEPGLYMVYASKMCICLRENITVTSWIWFVCSAPPPAQHVCAIQIHTHIHAVRVDTLCAWVKTTDNHRQPAGQPRSTDHTHARGRQSFTTSPSHPPIHSPPKTPSQSSQRPPRRHDDGCRQTYSQRPQIHTHT